MQTVYKYPIATEDNITIEMPIGAKPLSVQVQDGVICLWALVDTDAPMEKRRFRMAGTGHLISERIKQHVGTFQLLGGRIIFHLFEIS